MPDPASLRAPAAPILLVGQDRKGHWVVRHSLGLIEGIFVSRAAALHFAHQECQAIPGTRVAMADAALSSALAR
jgi:L-serine deaminase